jgi:predicted phosphoadenosine phosphosulfate sulfurtransferase
LREKIISYISKWLLQGYDKGLPDAADEKLESMNKVPSYRLICKAILKNDAALQTLGYSKENCDAYGMLKRIELAERAKNEHL